MAKCTKRTWTYKGVEKTTWIVRYVDKLGRHCQKSFDYKRDGEAFARVVTDQLLSGSHVSSARTKPVADVCDEFLRLQEDRWRSGAISQSRYVNICKAMRSIAPHLGRLKFNEMTTQDVYDCFRALLRTGRLQPSTAKERLVDFHMVAAYAKRRGYAREDVVSQALDEIGRLPRKRVRTFTPDQILKLLAACEVRPPSNWRRQFEMMRVIVNIAVFCGLRIGEIFALTASAIDLDRRVFHVRHSLTPFDELRPPKTAAGLRDVPMPQHVADLLRGWMRDHMVPEARGLVFRTLGRNRGVGASIGDVQAIVSRSNFHHAYWLPLLERAGLAAADGDHLHFHALRHFCASNMIRNGIDLVTVAAILGHAKYDMTLQVYAHSIVGGERRTEAMDAMASDLRGELLRNDCATAAKCLKKRDKKTVIKAFWNVDGSPWLTAPMQLENGYLASPFVGLDIPSP